MTYEIQNYNKTESKYYFIYAVENVMYEIQKSRSNIQKLSSRLLTPYHLINDATTYFDSYDIFIP